MLGLGIGVPNNDYAGGWTPADLSGLVGWYRFNTNLVRAGATSFPEDGEDVGRWGDASGSNNHASKTSDEPSYDEASKSVFFDSTAETFDIPQLSLGTFAMYARIKFTAAISSSDVLMQDDTTANNFWRVQSTTGIRCKIGGGAGAINYTLHSSNFLEQGPFYNMGLERDGDSKMSSYFNGAINGSAVLVDLVSKPFLVDSIHGGRDVLVSEVIITTNPLTSAERALLTTWLNSETEG